MSGSKPFRILGIQQIAIGGPSKERLKSLWVDVLGLAVKGRFVSERCQSGARALAVNDGAAPPSPCIGCR